MSQNTTATQPRTVQTTDRGKLDLKALTLYAILLAAGFVLNLTVSKFFSGLTGGFLSPEFIIAAFCSRFSSSSPTSANPRLSASSPAW